MIMAACQKAPNLPSIHWQTDIPPGKPVIYKFSTSWCPYCMRLEETVFQDPQVIALSKDFTMAAIDGDRPESDALMRQFDIKGYPTIIFTNGTGKEITRANDDTDPGHFLERMKMAMGASAPKKMMEIEKAQKEAEAPIVMMETATQKKPVDVTQINRAIELAQTFLETTAEQSLVRYEMAPDYIDTIVDGYKALGDTAKAEAALRRGALILLGRIQSAPQPARVHRLFSTTIAMLREAKFYTEAKNLAGLAINTWPTDYLYHKQLASVYIASLEGDVSRDRIVKKALHECGLAQKYAYGRNAVGVADLCSDFLMSLGKTQEARGVITWGIAQVDWTTNTRQKEDKLKTKLEARLSSLP